MRRFSAAVILLHILSQCFDSPIRWLLNMGHAAALIYLRDAALILSVLGSCYVIVNEDRNIAGSVLVIGVFTLGACVSLCSDLSLGQTLFGLKIWLPFIAAFLLVEADATRSLDKPRTWFLVWALLCMGIIINDFYRYPWSGLTVDIGSVAIEANREWTAAGVQRLSGFSRSSYEAATSVLLLYAYLACRIRAWLPAIFVTIVSGVAIALTTSKGVVAVFLCTALCLPLLNQCRTADSPIKPLCITALVLIASLGLALPLISMRLPLPNLRPGSPESWVFASLLERAWDTWPNSWALISDWQYFTGRGIGGIGVAQEYFEPAALNSADNFFLYLYITAGAVGGSFYVLLIIASTRLELHRPSHRVVYLCLLFVFVYGLTTNLVESAGVSLLIGALASLLISLWLETNTLHESSRSAAGGGLAALPRN